MIKKDCKLRKVVSDASCDSAIKTITQRTRKLRKSLHKIQKQFDNQAITKFFQRTLKAHSFARFGGDNDENACDAFTSEQLSNLSGSGDEEEVAKGDLDDIVATEDIAIDGNRENSNHKQYDTNENDDLLNSSSISDDHIDQNSNGSAHTNSHTSIQPDNIFLQKPVLHLTIDKSLMQASSIVINKHLDAGPNFAATFPVFNGTALNTANKQIQSKSSEDESSAELNDVQSSIASKLNDQKTKCEKPRLRKRRPRKCANNWMDNGALVDAIDSDSNSCDSGVVSDRSFELSSSDGNKLTTPHRIVCPSTTPTTTPTDEASQKMLQQQPSSNRVNVVKRPAVNRARGKQAQKG